MHDVQCMTHDVCMHVPSGGRAACIRSMGRMEGWDPMPSGGHGSMHRLRPSWQCMAMMSGGSDGVYVILNNIFLRLVF